jgi:excisionase family DNA binding protein
MEHLMTSEEVAEILHVEPITIRRLVNKGDLSAYRVGADYRFAPSDLEGYLQRQRIPAHGEYTSGYSPDSPLDQLTHWMRRMLRDKVITSAEVVDRFDRFTKRARAALTLAQEEARNLQHNYVGTEHLLLGLIREGGGVAGQVLNTLGADMQQLRQDIEKIIGHGDSEVTNANIPLTPRVKRAIELAVDEARQLRHQFLGTEHLLLGLMREGEGIAAHVLKERGIDLERVRAETQRVLQQKEQGAISETFQPAPEEAASLVPEGEQGVVCARCGTSNVRYFRYCFNCGGQLAGGDEPGRDD